MIGSSNLVQHLQRVQDPCCESIDGVSTATEQLGRGFCDFMMDAMMKALTQLWFSGRQNVTGSSSRTVGYAHHLSSFKPVNIPSPWRSSAKDHHRPIVDDPRERLWIFLASPRHGPGFPPAGIHCLRRTSSRRMPCDSSPCPMTPRTCRC